MKQILAGIIAASMIASSPVFAAEEINIVGSTTVLPIAQATAEAFMETNDVNITVGGGGSSVGAKAIVAGSCDIATMSRAMKQSEIEQAMTQGVTPKAYVVAMDGIAVVVNPANTVTALSLTDLKDIYIGKVKNWSVVGGTDSDIVVVSRDTASGTYEAFNKLALNEEKVRADALLQASNQAVLQTVAQTPNAIGYVGAGYVTNGVIAVEIDGILPTKETVLSKTYAISRPLYMYTNGEPTGAIKTYIDFVLSAEGQKIAEEEGFYGLA